MNGSGTSLQLLCLGIPLLPTFTQIKKALLRYVVIRSEEMLSMCDASFLNNRLQNAPVLVRPQYAPSNLLQKTILLRPDVVLRSIQSVVEKRDHSLTTGVSGIINKPW